MEKDIADFGAEARSVLLLRGPKKKLKIFHILIFAQRVRKSNKKFFEKIKQENSYWKKTLPFLAQKHVVSYYSAVAKKKFYILFIYLSDAEFHAESESVFLISGFHRLGGQSPQILLKVHPVQHCIP